MRKTYDLFRGWFQPPGLFYILTDTPPNFKLRAIGPQPRGFATKHDFTNFYSGRPAHVVEKRELKKGKCHSLANENIYHGFISLYSLLLNIEI